MNILVVTSECVPFIKVGGLADVAGTLPKYLKSLGHDVRIILPKYQSIDGKKYNLKTLPYRLQVQVGKDTESFRIKYHVTEDGVTVYFIENMRFFNRPGIYGDTNGDYPDNRERYVFFCKAVLEATKAILFRPDIINCNDWQTGLIPAYLKTTLKNDGFFWNTSSVYTIHNIAYQGSFGADTVEVAGFSWEDFVPNKLEFYNTVNFMKCGIEMSDAVSTVSPTYAKEIKDFNGMGMEIVLNSRVNKIYGILNGIDYSYWNPEDDKNIVANYSVDDMSGKNTCKKALQKLCGFKESEDAFLLGCVSRLDNQKGFDIIIDAINKVKNKNIQFAILGSGDPNIKKQLLEVAAKMPKNVAIFSTYDEVMAHRIYAGSDAYMMPSRFEPCGLSQMIALSYGSIPLVNRTGGLSDSIKQFDLKKQAGNGFVFEIGHGEDFVDTIKKAEKTFSDKKKWNVLVENALKTDLSWDKSVLKYQKMYQELADNKKYEAFFVRS